MSDIAYAKKLVQLSFSDKSLSLQHVKDILTAIKHKPSRRLKPILKIYLKLIKREVKHSTAVVEYAGEISQETIDEIQAMLNNETSRFISILAVKNNNLLAGIRISLGDNIREFSIASNLRTLEHHI